MNDLFILVGSFCGKENYSMIESYFKKNITVSNSEYERILLEGFKRNDKKAIMLSAPSVGKYPFSCKKLFTRFVSKEDNIVIANYFTLFFTNHLSKYRSLKKKINDIYKSNRSSNITVIGCEAHYPYLKLLKHCKKRLNLKTSLIVPDLPEDVSEYKTLIYRLAKKIETMMMYKLSNNFVDSFLFFTKEMTQKFRGGIKYIVREGIIEKISKSKETKNEKINCTYIGKVNEENGLLYICQAAKKLPNINFHIYGNGNLDNVLLSCKLKNLHFYGFIDPALVDQKISEADILLSPRLPREYTHYSFPSKLLKYISFCKPIVTYKLPCYPDSFDKCLIYPTNMSVKSFCDAILCAQRHDYLIDINNTINACGYLLAENVVSDYLKLML